MSRSLTNPAKSDCARKESADLVAVVTAFVEWAHQKPASAEKLLDLLKRADMAIEDAERSIRFESWDSSRSPVYFATEGKAFDWVEKQGWIPRSKCWSYFPDESEARITVYASEDDKNYGDIFEGYLIRPVAAFRALSNVRRLAIARHDTREHESS